MADRTISQIGMRRAVGAAIDEIDRALEAIDLSHQSATDRLAGVLVALSTAREQYDASARAEIEHAAQRDAALYLRHGETQDPGAYAVQAFRSWLDDLDDPSDALGALADGDAARVYAEAFLAALTKGAAS